MFYGFDDASLWVAVSFLIFLAGALWKGWGLATAKLDARAAGIREQLDEAQKLREEAQTAKATYQRLQRDALKEAEAILEHAKDEATRMQAEAETKLEQSLARREQQAVEKIQAAETKALAEVRGHMVDVAVAATNRLITENMNDATAKRLVAESIDEIPRRLQ